MIAAGSRAYTIYPMLSRKLSRLSANPSVSPIKFWLGQKLNHF